jgi:hypothetical protein
MNVLTPNRGSHPGHPPSPRPGELDPDAAPLIVGRTAVKAGGSLHLASDVLGWLGLALIALAVVDLAASVYPPAFANPEWEFGTLIVLLNGMPRVVLGLGLGAFASLNRKSTPGARRYAWSGVVVAVLLVAVSAYVIFTVGLQILAAQSDPALLLALRQQVAKAALQAVVLPLTLLVIARSALSRAPLD